MSIVTHCSKNLILDLSRLRISPILTQVRERSFLNKPRLRNPFWFVRKTRAVQDDLITTENQSFLKEVLHDKYGPPAFIKGVQSFENSAKSLLKVAELEKKEYTSDARRTGLLAKKIGEYPLWLKTGEKMHMTLLQVVDNHVIKYTPPEQYQPMHRPNVHNLQNYGCLLVGAESIDPSLLTRDYCNIFKDSGVIPKKYLGRFLVTPSAALLPGTPLNATHFQVGGYVDVRGKTIYRGFQGVVKRHGFKGMPKTHGVTKTHRRPGNIGGGGEKGRVWPGTKLPGHMGNRYRKLKGLRIWRINTKYNVLYVRGPAVPGETNSLVYVYDSILPTRKHTAPPPFPTSFDDDLIEPLPEDIWLDEVHNFKDETISFVPEQ